MTASQNLPHDMEKAQFNSRAKASMRKFMQAKSWVEKVRSIERMNVAKRLARQAMQTINPNSESPVD